MDRTLVFESAAPLTGLTFKFPNGHFEGLLAQLRIEGVLYKMYYFSPAKTVCIRGEGKGVIAINAGTYTKMVFTLSGTAITLDGNDVGFDPSQTECRYASNLVAETFSWKVAELIIEDTLATTMATALTTYTELPMESCQSLDSPGVCATCAPRYLLASPTCSKQLLW